jgi:hypothetical protein
MEFHGGRHGLLGMRTNRAMRPGVFRGTSSNGVIALATALLGVIRALKRDRFRLKRSRSKPYV